MTVVARVRGKGRRKEKKLVVVGYSFVKRRLFMVIGEALIDAMVANVG